MLLVVEVLDSFELVVDVEVALVEVAEVVTAFAVDVVVDVAASDVLELIRGAPRLKLGVE